MDDDVIACSLDAGKLKDRLAWITSLNARSLRSSNRDDLTLTLDYDPVAIEDVRKMIAGEQSCCAFLDFVISENLDVVRVSIVAPEGARAAAQALFEPFASGVRQDVAKPCSCKSECGA
jgi:hypothetical protein